jgi:DNA-binding LacI/PurR family transcriptional regulator
LRPQKTCVKPCVPRSYASPRRQGISSSNAKISPFRNRLQQQIAIDLFFRILLRESRIFASDNHSESAKHSSNASGWRTGENVTEKVRIRNINDLAKLAGVSPGTVSRALSDTGLISQKTRDRIKALAREHDFRPNVMARNLRIQKTGAIGVIIPLGHDPGQHISDPFFITMLGLLADALTEKGYDLVLSRCIPTDEDWLDRFVDSGRVDGVIVIGQSDQSAVLDKVAARYRPLVVWGGYSQGQVHCSVGSDNRLGGELATAHLIERGCKRIAFFGDPNAMEFRLRLEGCKAAMKSAGLSEEITVFPAHLLGDSAHPDITEFLDSASQRPQGIVAAADTIAMTTLRVLAEQKLSVPDDVKVIGYDGLALTEQTFPRLSTVKQDLTTGAHNLVDMLLRRIAGEETTSVILQPELVVRNST